MILRYRALETKRLTVGKRTSNERGTRKTSNLSGTTAGGETNEKWMGATSNLSGTTVGEGDMNEKGISVR